MIQTVIPLVYVMALGFVAYRLCNAAFPVDQQLGPRQWVLFTILHVTGFLLAAILPAPYAVFLVVAIISVLILMPPEPVERIALFVFLFPVLPSLDYDLHIGIPFMWMTWPRLLTIILLLPLLAGAFSRKSFFHYPIDKFVWAFFLLNAVLAFRDTSFTNGLRGVTYVTIDFLAPYLVLSRYLESFADIRKVMFALLAALVFTGLVCVFETVRTWHLYEQLMINVNGARYMAIERIGLLRATGPFGIPSRAGFAMTAGLGLCWALSPFLDRRWLTRAIIAILIAALFVTFSRGNWIGGAIVGMCFLFTINRKQFLRVAAALAVVFVLLSSFDFADDIVGVLPFIGTEESEAAGTVDYREQLFAASILVAGENPWFGSSTFHEHPELVALRQGSGLLDLVNHYLIVLLNTGYTGLILFCCIFLSTLSALRRTLRNKALGSDADLTLCRAIMYTLVGMLVAITTTSALGRVGLIIWMLVAMTAVATRLLEPVAKTAQIQHAN